MFLQGETAALFLRHEGYLGAIGAFMNSNVFKESEHWGENYGTSVTRKSRKSVSTLELDIIDIPMEPFPYLKAQKSYEADTWDLTDDSESSQVV